MSFLHGIIFRRVITLHIIPVLSKNPASQGNLIAAGRLPHYLIRSVVGVSLQKQPLIYIWFHYGVIWNLITFFRIVTVAWIIGNILFIRNCCLIYLSNIFIISTIHKFSQVQFVSLGHLRGFFKILTIGREEWILSNDARVLFTDDILVGIHVLEPCRLHLGLLVRASTCL